MTYLPHQIEYGKKVKKILKKKGYVYLVSPPRAGKTMTALYAVEHIKQIKKVLVITKKNAFGGWLKFTKHLTKDYTIINKESLHKIKKMDFDVVILDEAHTITANVGRKTVTFERMRKLLYEYPQILISATPFVETHNSVYYQMGKSKYTPFKHKTFYDFFREYGIPDPIRIGKDEWQETYKKSKKKLLKKIAKFTVTMPKVFNANTTDILKYFELNKKQKEYYNTIVKDKYLKVGKHEFTADTLLKERLLLHQIEGGVIKDDEGKALFIGSPKIDFVNSLKGKVGVMVHFANEKNLFNDNVEVYSSNAHAEGVDLSHLDYFVIYSQDYSGAKHIQRKDRIVNMNGSKTTNVIYLLVKNGISEQVYNTCSNKEDFNNKTYKRLSL